MDVVLEGVAPYDGRYELDFERDLTTREWGWIKRLAGYLPLTLDDSAFGDPELGCVLAAIALRRSGRIQAAEVPAVFERLVDAPFGSAIRIEGEPEGDDAESPPPPSSSSNGATSGDDSVTNSETLVLPPKASGSPSSATSETDPPTSVT